MATSLLETFELKVPTQERNQLVEVTREIEGWAARNRLKNAVIFLYSPHTTAGVTIQENADPTVKSDLLAKLQALVPKSESYYQHGEGNSDAHLKTALTGNSVMAIVENGRLKLGKWQGLYLCEFDGPRERTLWIKVIHHKIHHDELG